MRKKRIFYSKTQWGRRHHLTSSDIWESLLQRTLEIIKKQDSWISNNELCRIINKEFDISLKPRQIGFIVRVLRFNLPIESKKSSNPFYQSGPRGIFGKRDPRSTYPRAYLYHRWELIKELGEVI